MLSTLYSAGQRSGEVAERQHSDAGFANHYEWSKWAAEQAVLSAADLPVSVLRLPTIIADGDDGQVTQYNAFHNTLKLYFYGLLSLVPGNPSTPVSLATASFTTSAIIRLLDPAVADGIYHVCPDPADTPTLGQLLTTAFAVFEQDSSFRRRQLLTPEYCDQESFDDLVAAASRFRGGAGAGVVGLGLLVRDPAVLAEDIPQRRTAGRLARLPGSGPEHLGAGGV